MIRSGFYRLIRNNLLIADKHLYLRPNGVADKWTVADGASLVHIILLKYKEAPLYSAVAGNV